MEILLKRDGSEKTTTNIKELAELLDIASVRLQLKRITDSIEELKKVPKIDKKAVLNMIKDEFLTKGEVLNIISASSIEKEKNVPVGILYYNDKLDEIRLHSKNGWVTLKIE